MLITRTILSLAMLIMTLVSAAQVDSLRLDKKYFRHYLTDTRDLVLAPLNIKGNGWKGRDWAKLAAVAGITAALTLTDEDIRDFFQDNRTASRDDITKYGLEPFANTYGLLITGGMLLHGTLAGNGRSTSTGLLAAESFIISTLLVRIPKYMAGRIRPDAWWGPGPYEWEVFGKGRSFPSGHTTTAFAMATVFAFQYKDTPWVPVTAYTLATLSGLSRAYDNRHWFSDIFTGAVFGIATARFICKKHQESRLTVLPAVSGGTSGLSILYKW